MRIKKIKKSYFALVTITPKVLRSSACINIFHYDSQKDTCCDACLRVLDPIIKTRRANKNACKRPRDEKWKNNRFTFRIKRYELAKKCLGEQLDKVIMTKEAAHPSVRSTSHKDNNNSNDKTKILDLELQKSTANERNSISSSDIEIDSFFAKEIEREHEEHLLEPTLAAEEIKSIAINGLLSMSKNDAKPAAINLTSSSPTSSLLSKDQEANSKKNSMPSEVITTSEKYATVPFRRLRHLEKNEMCLDGIIEVFKGDKFN